MVFLYVRGADDRATEAQAPVQVLKAVAQINPGETLEAAQAAGKLELGTVPASAGPAGAVNSIETLTGPGRALAGLPQRADHHGKFGSPGDQDSLTLPDGKIAISVTCPTPAGSPASWSPATRWRSS